MRKRRGAGSVRVEPVRAGGDGRGDAHPQDTHAREEQRPKLLERADKRRRCLECSEICRGFGLGCLRLCLWSPKSFPRFRNQAKRQRSEKASLHE
jgi:hypothetical protein